MTRQTELLQQNNTRNASATADGGDFIYSADLKVCATVYVRARSPEEAQAIVNSLAMTPLHTTGDRIGEHVFDGNFPRLEFAETMTIHGQFEGDWLEPRYDVENDRALS